MWVQRTVSLWSSWDIEPNLVGLWPTSGIRIPGPDCQVPEEIQKNFVSCETGGECKRIQVSVAMSLQCPEVAEDLCFLWCWFVICQLVHHPVPVEEVEGLPIHTLCGASLYTLKIFNENKYRSLSFCIE